MDPADNPQMIFPVGVFAQSIMIRVTNDNPGSDIEFRLEIWACFLGEEGFHFFVY